MKILVTGAAGFIGSHLSERLLELAHDVVGIDNLSNYYSSKLKEINVNDIKAKGIKFLRRDLSEDSLTSAVEGVEVVFHLAAQPGISTNVSFETYMKNNVTATYKLLEALKESKTLKLFVNTATSSVYGLDASSSEETAPAPASFYGVTKLAAEQLALSYQRNKVLPVCSLRLFSVYGPRERPEKLYPKLINSILNDEDFPLRDGSEKHIRSYTYISDIISGYELVLKNMHKCDGEIFNIGTDKTITTGNAITIVEDILGTKARIKNVPRLAGDQAKTQANIEKARRILGYDPKVSPREGLQKTIEWNTRVINR